MLMQMVFSKVHLACPYIANGIKRGRLISMLPIDQKLYVGAKMIYVRCINCSYKNVAKDIPLLDKKKHFFLFIQKKFHSSKSF